MVQEVHFTSRGLDGFYAAPLGAVTRRLLRARLRALWPELTGREVLGLGHAGPYLRLWRRGAARLVSATPHALAVHHRLAPWPPDGRSAATLVEEDRLPFADLSFDNVLLVHGLEAAENARRLLREAWRVLRPEGRLLAVVPNRRSVWAHLEHTPFGHGHPYSAGQLARLLDRSLFAVERREHALFVPPFPWRPLLRGARAWEAAGRAVAPQFAGVTLIEARKSVAGLIPLRPAPARVRVLMPQGG
ncbi:methyltransferase domain-containing protein [Muricoccus radiodurans]|uniref:methyltransferase domain-containing protein n=1 Tax=Muricoccus radiodurans TaxID=2231721 RepID=UPI003CEE8038